MRSNTYTLIFTSLITLILGFLLSFTYTQLKSMQQENLAVDIRKNILRMWVMIYIYQTILIEDRMREQ